MGSPQMTAADDYIIKTWASIQQTVVGSCENNTPHEQVTKNE